MLSLYSASMSGTTDQIIGDQVRAELARKRLSQEVLAGVLDISRAAVGERILGKTPFKARELAIASNLLGVPVETFYPPTTLVADVPSRAPQFSGEGAA